MNAQGKMNKELTGDNIIDWIITTPQSQWSAYQIATANLNPELKQRNKRYQSAFNNYNILQNEKVNLWEAGQIMMNAYKEAVQRTADAADAQMAANAATANIQAGWAISWMAWLATNPAAAAMARASAMNNAAIQNAQVRSNADQNIANLYNSMAWVPAQMTSMSQANAQIDSNNRQLDIQERQAEAQNNLTNAQAQYYRRQWSWSSSSSSSNENLWQYIWSYTYVWDDWKEHTVELTKDWDFKYDWEVKKNANNQQFILDKIKEQIANEASLSWWNLTL